MANSTRMATYTDSVATDGNYGHNGIYYDTYDEMMAGGRTYIENFEPSGDVRTPQNNIDILNVERPVGMETQASNELLEYYNDKLVDASRDPGTPAIRWNDIMKFKEAFGKARKYGEDSFMWEDKPYSTELK